MGSTSVEARERITALTIAISVRSLPRIVGSLLETKLTLQQFKVLTAIVVDDGLTTRGLAAAFGVSMATISKLLDRLVAQGVVERSTDPDDQRVRRLRATPLGREIVGRIVGAQPELGGEVLEGLSPEELDALERGLKAINRELQRIGSHKDADRTPASPNDHA